jgi:hypothetical protein
MKVFHSPARKPHAADAKLGFHDDDNRIELLPVLTIPMRADWAEGAWGESSARATTPAAAKKRFTTL